MAVDRHEQIRCRAYEIWEAEGRPEGAAFRHWLQASDELSEGDEPETMENLLDEDDHDDDERAKPVFAHQAGQAFKPGAK